MLRATPGKRPESPLSVVSFRRLGTPPGPPVSEGATAAPPRRRALHALATPSARRTGPAHRRVRRFAGSALPRNYLGLPVPSRKFSSYSESSFGP